MDDLNHVLTFARVAQAGSFAAAAERLGIAPSVASKHVAKLERALGARLLQRSTRKLSLTEAGRAYYEHCARIVEELEQSRAAVASLQAEPGGRLRVTCINSFAGWVIAPMLPAFFERYPKIALEIVTSDRMIDLAEEGFDLALRITGSPQPNLVARRITEVRFLVVGTPEYFARYGMPETPSDLARHNCLGFPLSVAEHVWRFTRGGEQVAVNVGGSLDINNVDALRYNALAGVGVALLPSFAVGKYLRDGRLVAPLPDWRGFNESTLYAAYLPNRYGSPKLRAFVDFLVETIGDPPYWDTLDLPANAPVAARRR
ncbi:LysR family transcriptional regulator [Sinimarinibacterium flocculans]